VSQDEDKRAAAIAAAAEVRDGMLVGLGTGSTAAFLIEELGRRFAEGLRFDAVATSLASEAQAAALGILVRPFETVGTVDLAIDGADEIDAGLRAIKGAGGAMLREKCVAAAAQRMVVIADASKSVSRLGGMPVPCETLPFARAFVERALSDLGGTPTLRMRGDQPYRTDQANLILDCRFHALEDPATLATRLSSIPGMMGHGLFVDEIDALYLSCDGTVRRIERPV
jgi:ribose 5-phosphate isomerase A